MIKVRNNNMSLEDGSTEEREFSFLSDVLPEDKELRKQLQIDRLEFVIKVQEEERRCETRLEAA